MSEFLKILTHGRRLQGAVKDLTVTELEEVAAKLGNVIEARKQKEQEAMQAEKEKQAKLEEIRKQLADAGLGIDDLAAGLVAKASKGSGQKRPIKYRLKDKEGNEHTWTGIGRMPKVFAAAIESGKKLDKFKV